MLALALLLPALPAPAAASAAPAPTGPVRVSPATGLPIGVRGFPSPAKGSTPLDQRGGLPAPGKAGPDSLPTQPSGELAVAVKQFEETSYYLKDTDFVTAAHGWAVGSPHWDQATHTYTGTIITTRDGGLTWRSQPAGTAETLRAVDFVDDLHGWAAGTNGVIVRTVDGGAHWTRQAVPTSDEFRGISFVDATHGWATGIHATHRDWLGDEDNWAASIWHTVDGGATWAQQSVPGKPDILNRIKFVDAQNGWAVGIRDITMDELDPQQRLAVYHTHDGGATWELQYGPDLEIVLTGVDFVDAQNGWAVGFIMNTGVDGGTIFHTTDGGVTWQEQTPQDNLWDVQFVDPNRGYAVGMGYGLAWGPPVYRTQNGGATWEEVIQDHHEGDALFGIAVMADRAVAVGDHDFVVISTIPWGSYGWPWGGNLFSQYFINTHYTWQSVFALNASQLWVVGASTSAPELTQEAIMHSSDGGSSWQIQYQTHATSSSSLKSVSFADAQHGWAVGVPGDSNSPGAILYTANGGQTWTEQGHELAAGWFWGFLAVRFLDSQRGWALSAGRSDISGQPVSLAHTVNGGATWSWVDTPVDGSTMTFGGGLSFVDAQHGWIVGGLGEALSTNDGGAHWAAVTVPCQMCRLHAVSFADPSHGWIAGEGQYETRDGGTSWVERDLGVGGDINAAQMVDAKNGWMAGDSAAILYTTDGGVTWRQAVDNVTYAALHGLSFVAPGQGWLAGDGGVILTMAEIPFWWQYLPIVVR
jgi:photosystem II stability/assembly factor-like uncharacterized protein